MNYGPNIACQDVQRWLLGGSSPDVLNGSLLIMKGSAKIQMEINLESQALDEDMYYYGYSKEEVLSSPSDLLGEFRASCSKLMANHEIKNT